MSASAAPTSYQKKPCNECPFRKTSDPLYYINQQQPVIHEMVANDRHICHKTQSLPLPRRLQCAGHMLLMDSHNLYHRLLKAMRLPINLTGRELVFDTVDDAVAHHSQPNQSTNA